MVPAAGKSDVSATVKDVTPARAAAVRGVDVAVTKASASVVSCHPKPEPMAALRVCLMNELYICACVGVIAMPVILSTNAAG